MQCIYAYVHLAEKDPHMNVPMQLEPVLFKGPLYLKMKSTKKVALFYKMLDDYLSRILKESTIYLLPH